MSTTEGISFKRNLRSYLGLARLSRSPAAGSIARVTRSLSADPVEPIDAVFTTISDDYHSSDPNGGFQSVTRQLLANDVLDSLIQMQSEMSLMGDAAPNGMEFMEAKVAEIYQRTQTGLPLAGATSS